MSSAKKLGLALLALLLLGACEPRDEFPGLRIGGTPAEVPADFGFSSEHPEIFLEARGAVLPRVVTIWCVPSGEKLYVWGDPDSGWTRRVAKRPDVRVRIGDGTYELTAAEVTDADEREWVVAAYAAKYSADLEAIFERPATVDDFELVYRLTRR